MLPLECMVTQKKHKIRHMCSYIHILHKHTIYIHILHKHTAAHICLNSTRHLPFDQCAPGYAWSNELWPQCDPRNCFNLFKDLWRFGLVWTSLDWGLFSSLSLYAFQLRPWYALILNATSSGRRSDTPRMRPALSGTAWLNRPGVSSWLVPTKTKWLPRVPLFPSFPGIMRHFWGVFWLSPWVFEDSQVTFCGDCTANAQPAQSLATLGTKLCTGAKAQAA